METSTNGRNIIREFEGERLNAYQDSVGVWTIGVGHTSAAGAPAVSKGLTITKQQSDDILSRDLKTYEAAVLRQVKVPLNQNQFDALVSFTYNLGEGNFAKSTLLKRVNVRDFAGAKAQFSAWNKAGGKVLAGLTRRRAAEAKLFGTTVTAPSSVAAATEPAPTRTPTALGAAILSLFASLFGRRS